jgi:hypothetical protein
MLSWLWDRSLSKSDAPQPIMLLDIWSTPVKAVHTPQLPAAVTALGGGLGVDIGLAANRSAGNKVEQWFKTPFDIAAFGPRATLGALLSMPERLQTL